MKNVTRIEVGWDTQDASNHGWAWYSYAHDERSGQDELLGSGALDGRESCGNKTLSARARAEAGVSGSRTPVRITRAVV